MKNGKLLLKAIIVLATAILFVPRVAYAVAPTISDIPDQSTAEDTPLGPIAFTVGDVDTDPALLTVTAVSDNQVLLPDANITLGGSGTGRTISLNPAANQNGTATVTVTVSDGVDSAVDTFLFSVTAVNDQPQIGSITAQTIAVNGTTAALPFTVSDVETAAGALVVTASSSNPTLVPNLSDNLTLGGSGANRTITVTPAANKAGVATITLTVNDGSGQPNATNSTQFTVTVNNTPPTITSIAPQVISEDGATAALAFTVGDSETPAGSLIVTASSSNTTLVPNLPANLTLGGTGAARTLTVTPAANQSGTSTITVSVSDGIDSTPTQFLLTVNAVNDPPTITPISDVTIDMDTSTGAIPFTIGDVDNTFAELTVTAQSSNPVLVPLASMTLGGVDASRTITVTPAVGQSGTATITVTVTDPATAAAPVTTEAFLLTVNYVNQPPTITPIGDQTTNEDTPTAVIPFQIGDDLTPPLSLSVTAVSTNTLLVPNSSGITLGGTGITRTIRLSPSLNLSGTTRVIVTVSDGFKSVDEDFLLEVLPVNDAPTVDLNGVAAGTGYLATYYTNGNPAVLSAAGLLVGDVDNTTLSGATVTITNLLDGTAELLAANVTGTAIAASYSGGVLTLSGVDTLANYAQVLKTVTYRNTALVPNITDRTVQFTVNDGLLSSTAAVATVDVLDPRLQITVTPIVQTVPSGGTAAFSLTVTNIGNVPLSSVSVASPQIPSCQSGWSWPNLAAGETRNYSCFRTAVTNEITAVFTVTGKDANLRTVSASANSRVEVENPNIQIVKSPTSQIVRKGETATFEVFLFNPSTTVDLVQVSIDDPLAPDCSRSGDWENDFLPSSQEVVYSCALQNVTAAFTNVITATGKNQLTNQVVSDSSVAFVDLLDLTADLEVTPTSVAGSGNLLTYTLTVNNSGTVDVDLTGLTTDQFGLLTGSGSGQLLSNTCNDDPLPTLSANGGTFTCMFTAEPAVAPPEFSVTVEVDGEDDSEGLPISATATATVEVQAQATLAVSVSANPNSVDAPGGNVRYGVTIRNDNPSGTITVGTLADSRLGDLDGVGTCSTPITLAVQDSYTCSFQTRVNGQVGDVVSRTVTATGTTGSGKPVSGQGQAAVTIKNPRISTILLPMVAANYPPVENNDVPCEAYGIATNVTYSFLLDDPDDWYYFDLPVGRDVTLDVKNLPTVDNQVAIWTGTGCRTVTQLVGYNGASLANKTILMKALAPGRYYVLVLNDDSNRAFTTPYTLRVSVP